MINPMDMKQFLDWTDKDGGAVSGSLYSVVTKDHQTSFIIS
jgi:hypothetical protein